jgi:hypothetical protein
MKEQKDSVDTGEEMQSLKGELVSQRRRNKLRQQREEGGEAVAGISPI